MRPESPGRIFRKPPLNAPLKAAGQPDGETRR